MKVTTSDGTVKAHLTIVQIDHLLYLATRRMNYIETCGPVMDKERTQEYIELQSIVNELRQAGT